MNRRAEIRAEIRAALETQLGHVFRNAELLERALTHSSVGDGRLSRRRESDNERLEFLGDRVLGLLTAETLIGRDPAAHEGALALRLNALVNREACAAAARRMGLGPALRLSPSETRAGGRDKANILADACEAVMAAVYLDGGLEAARRVYETFWTDPIMALTTPETGVAKDPKSELQERIQGLGRPAPVYRVIAREGPDHAPVFTVEAEIEGFAPALATGASRQAAEKAAARRLLDQAFG